MSAGIERVRIGLQPHLPSIPPGTGHGNVWHHVLRELSAMAEVQLIVPRAGETLSDVDVWLGDGHHGPPLKVSAPVVVAVHEAGWNTEFLRSLLERKFVEVMDRETAACCRAAGAIIVPSESSRRQLIDYYKLTRTRIYVVPYGVDHSVFRAGLAGGPALVAAAGGDAKQPYVLYVGQRHARKNFGAVRAAMDELALRNFPHELVCVLGATTEGVSDNDVRAVAAPLPRSGRAVVSIPQASDDQLAALMASAAALCQPSFMEGFGLPVLEAMGCGTPVITSDRGALPEIVGSAGIIISPTATDLAQALAGLFRDPKLTCELRENGSRRAANFSWLRTARGWLRAIQAVVAA